METFGPPCSNAIMWALEADMHLNITKRRKVKPSLNWQMIICYYQAAGQEAKVKNLKDKRKEIPGKALYSS